MNEEKIEIRSEEVQEILGKPPRRIIRWGISIIFFVILIILIGSYFFKYPEIIKSNVTITTQNPPVFIVANVSGRIANLLVQDTQLVKANQLLAVIENPANYKDILLINQIMDSLYISIIQFDTIILPLLSKPFALGEIQPGFTTFLKSYIDYKTFLELDYYKKKTASVKVQIVMSNLFYDRLYRQRNILEKEYKIAEKDYIRSKLLHEQNVISDADIEKAESNLLSKKYAFEGARSSLANTKIQIQNLEQSILELQLKKSEETKRLQLEIRNSYSNFLAQLAAWRKKYLIISPINGKVSFSYFWSKNQNVTIGDRVLSIIPEGAGCIIAKLNLALAGSGKVKEGQNVNIKLLSYPYMEFGMIKGIIKTISLVPNKETYLVEVTLPNGLKTNYGTKLKFSQEMTGEAEIITEDISLFQRILNPIISLIKKNFK